MLSPSLLAELNSTVRVVKRVDCYLRLDKMIYTIVSLLVLFWLVGLVAHVGGSFIHGLLVLALIVFVFDLITGRKAAL